MLAPQTSPSSIETLLRSRQLSSARLGRSYFLPGVKEKLEHYTYHENKEIFVFQSMNSYRVVVVMGFKRRVTKLLKVRIVLSSFL